MPVSWSLDVFNSFLSFISCVATLALVWRFYKND